MKVGRHQDGMGSRGADQASRLTTRDRSAPAPLAVKQMRQPDRSQPSQRSLRRLAEASGPSMRVAAGWPGPELTARRARLREHQPSPRFATAQQVRGSRGGRRSPDRDSEPSAIPDRPRTPQPRRGCSPTTRRSRGARTCCPADAPAALEQDPRPSLPHSRSHDRDLAARHAPAAANAKTSYQQAAAVHSGLASASGNDTQSCSCESRAASSMPSLGAPRSPARRTAGAGAWV